MNLLRRVATLSLVVCGGALIAGTASSIAASDQLGTVSTAKLTGTFTARVLQGPETGTVYAGKLSLAGSRTGRLTGTLMLAGSKRGVAVNGQIDGQLIGLSIALGVDKTISGTGVVGYNPMTKRNTVGGTFSGPSSTALGVWDYESQTSAGGCLIGISTNGSTNPSRPGLCYVVR